MITNPIANSLLLSQLTVDYNQPAPAYSLTSQNYNYSRRPSLKREVEGHLLVVKSPQGKDLWPFHLFYNFLFLIIITLYIFNAFFIFNYNYK